MVKILFDWQCRTNKQLTELVLEKEQREKLLCCVLHTQKASLGFRMQNSKLFKDSFKATWKLILDLKK